MLQMMMRTGGLSVVVHAWLAVFPTLVTPLAAAAAWAPLPQPANPGKATCADVLTDDEVLAAVGRRGAAAEKNENEPGNSQCRWTWSDTESSVTVNYTTVSGIDARAASTRCCPDRSKPSAAQFFDYAIRMDVDLGSEPPAALTGIGERAALFFEDAYLKLVVQRADGVASIVGANITREQMLALAKAIAAP
jgi:hypothetical protein